MLDNIPLVQRMLDQGDTRILMQDIEGNYRFHAEITNANDLLARLTLVTPEYASWMATAKPALLDVYEAVFHHQSFTGRSGGMFGFEGLGCIYWHMVSKLLLAVQENYFAALAAQADAATIKALGEYYYRVRKGIGFNKSPQEYGAFPTDPYSHTPKHAGAQQPGMTGQVKEEVLTRFGELGIEVRQGMVSFTLNLLRKREFTMHPNTYSYLDVFDVWQSVALPARAIAFTWCQVPILYVLTENGEPNLVIHRHGEAKTVDRMWLTADESASIFQRDGSIQQLTLTLPSTMLFVE